MPLESTKETSPSYAEAAGESHEAYTFYCPGCEHTHIYYVKWGERSKQQSPTWNFNGNMERPTFTPSLLNKCDWGAFKENPQICHLFLTNGILEFCSDSTHKYAGQKIPLP
mgnify:CR=1 FL=1